MPTQKSQKLTSAKQSITALTAAKSFISRVVQKSLSPTQSPNGSNVSSPKGSKVLRAKASELFLTKGGSFISSQQSASELQPMNRLLSSVASKRLRAPDQQRQKRFLNTDICEIDLNMPRTSPFASPIASPTSVVSLVQSPMISPVQQTKK